MHHSSNYKVSQSMSFFFLSIKVTLHFLSLSDVTSCLRGLAAACGCSPWRTGAGSGFSDGGVPH